MFEKVEQAEQAEQAKREKQAKQVEILKYWKEMMNIQILHTFLAFSCKKEDLETQKCYELGSGTNERIWVQNKSTVFQNKSTEFQKRSYYLIGRIKHTIRKKTRIIHIVDCIAHQKMYFIVCHEVHKNIRWIQANNNWAIIKKATIFEGRHINFKIDIFSSDTNHIIR